MMQRSKVAWHGWLWLVLVCMLPWPALAMGIGEWRVQSYLGERLEAEADIFHDAAELIDPECFKLAYPGVNSDFPALNGGQLIIKSTAKGMSLKLASSRIVNDPIIQIRLKISCGASQIRDMVLFLSPKEIIQPGRSESATLTALSAPSQDAQANPSSKQKPGTGSHLANGTKLERGISRKPSKSAAGNRSPRRAHQSSQNPSTAPRLVLSSELDPEILDRLKLSNTLRLAPTEATQEEREQLRRLYRSMMYLADLKEGRATQANRPVLPEGLLPAPPSIPDNPATDAVLAGSSTQAPSSTAIVDGVQQPPAMPMEPQDNWRLSSWWIPLLAVLLLALLLGLLLWLSRRRKPAAGVLPEALEPMPSIHNVKLRSESTNNQPETLESLLKNSKSDIEEKPAAEKKKNLTSEFAQVHGVTVHSESPSFLTSYRTMLDLAESMMAFGLVNDATDALKEYVEDHPQVAVEPWLKLLDVLRQAGKKTEFDQYSLKLRQNFNLDLPGWDEQSADATATSPDSADLDERFASAPSPLEAFPHIRDRIASLWGTPDCAVYLQHLIRDNRSGKRRGFPLVVVDDILLLIDIVEDLTGVDSEASIRERPEIFSDTW